MYIDPFLCGVIATILTEIGVIIIGTVVSEYRKSKRRRTKEDEVENKDN